MSVARELISRRHWQILLVIVVLAYVTSLLVAYLTGVETALPWSFVAEIAAVLLPGGYLLAELVAYADRKLDFWYAVGGGLGVGLVLVLAMKPTLDAPVLLGAVLVPAAAAHIYFFERSHILPVIELLVILFFGFALVWNLSYLGTSWVGDRAQDWLFRYMDLKVYGLVLGVDEYAGLFPLVQRPLILRILQNGYLIFYLEVFFVAFVLEREDDSFAFIVRFLAAHIAGALFFLIYPVFGPYILFPDSIREGFHGSPGWSMMQIVVQEYRAVMDGGSLTGAGYFVGLPSLHTAGAIIFQASIRKHRTAFYLLLPFNVCMVLATFILGFHYLLDVVGGVALAASVWLLPRLFQAVSSRATSSS